MKNLKRSNFDQLASSAQTEKLLKSPVWRNKDSFQKRIRARPRGNSNLSVASWVIRAPGIKSFRELFSPENAMLAKLSIKLQELWKENINTENTPRIGRTPKVGVVRIFRKLTLNVNAVHNMRYVNLENEDLDYTKQTLQRTNIFCYTLETVKLLALSILFEKCVRNLWPGYPRSKTSGPCLSLLRRPILLWNAVFILKILTIRRHSQDRVWNRYWEHLNFISGWVVHEPADWQYNTEHRPTLRLTVPFRQRIGRSGTPISVYGSTMWLDRMHWVWRRCSSIFAAGLSRAGALSRRGPLSHHQVSCRSLFRRAERHETPTQKHILPR